MELGSFETTLVRLFDTSAMPLVAAAVAFVVGAAHAVAPGHGKTITAAYLVTGRARPRDAVMLGGAVAAMHTLSVVVLALAWVTAAAASSLASDHVTAWMQVVSAGLVATVGGVLVHRRRAGSEVDHHHDHHPTPGHGSGHPHAHEHHDGTLMTHPAVSAPPALSRRMLLALALSGGLLPSPSAFLVLVTGMLSGRVLLAWMLVGAFGVGLAATLSAVGLATIRGREALAERIGRSPLLEVVHRWIPVIGAYAVLVLGLAYLALGLAVLLS